MFLERLRPANDSKKAPNYAETVLELMSREEAAWKRGPRRAQRVRGWLTDSLERCQITSGRFLEIGGRDDPMSDIISEPEWEYWNLDLSDGGNRTIVADITACPEVETESFDVVASNDVLEHVDRPWLAAAEMHRILRPGGLVFVSTLFSWRYHPCPHDYFRFTPDGLRVLFADFDEVTANWDTTERRRSIDRLSDASPVPLDALGGWRENVRVWFVGRKPLI